MSNNCTCGQPATSSLSLRYRRRRPSPEPEAMDPWYVHGSAPVTTCGSPACEAAAVLRELHHAGADLSFTICRRDEEVYAVACGDHVHEYTAAELAADVNKQCGW